MKNICCVDINLSSILTFLGTIIAVYVAYKSIMTKIKQDRKAIWIEDFRNQISAFSSMVMLYSSNSGNSSDDLRKIVETSTLILLYLDNEKKNHKELESLISSVALSVSADSSSQQLRKYPVQFKKIIDLARKIIIDEETAIK